LRNHEVILKTELEALKFQTRKLEKDSHILKELLRERLNEETDKSEDTLPGTPIKAIIGWK